ncbi:DUF4145 domain-containing protein [Dysosmobacter welbionis]|uniref:DUF4145 domain-containing protein n=1 Tax=Dysosmobacter welbionis TaxID=2093857 RepID=UPI0032BFA501
MASRHCPYCGIEYFVSSQLQRSDTLTFNANRVEIIYYTWSICPKCNKASFTLAGKHFDSPVYFSYPPASAMFLPDYIPAAIRQDYLEAVKIAGLSPKASATLARRCLQGMIHDFWNIKEKNLNAEITALKTHIPRIQWEAIDAVRKIGNIGAHMEKDVELMVDVDPGEAEKLLKVIELLFKNWYIAEHENQQLYAEIAQIAEDKENERKSGAVDSNGQ